MGTTSEIAASGTVPMLASADELAGVQATAARIACEQMTAPAMKLLLDSVERATDLPTRPGWERKAAAHAEFFHLLGGLAGDRAAGALTGQARLIGDLMRTAGPAANGMIISSRRRLLARLRAGDADGAALEIEEHLRVLHYMGRLADSGAVRRRARKHPAPMLAPGPFGKKIFDPNGPGFTGTM
jgi:DNA-binding FadR family transcriptional regulator